MDFIQAYGYLDMMCRNMLHNNRGVSAYLEQMRNTPDGATVVQGWEDDLKRLEECRRIRNVFAHYPQTQQEDRTEAIRWLSEFAARIMSGTDPITQYQKAT